MARIRLPLQLGRAGLGQSVRFAATVWIGPLLLVLAAAPFSALSSATLGFLCLMAIGTAGILAIGYALWALDIARRDRPTDVILDDGGFTAAGRAGGDVHVTWAEVSAGKCRVIDAEARRSPGWNLLSWLFLGRVAAIARRARIRVRRLILSGASKEDVVLAEAAGTAEIESLERLFDVIRVGAGPADAEGVPSLPPEILRCPACQAPAVPADAPSVQCRFCGTAITVPESLRERQRAAAELAASDATRARTVRRLIDQPGAERAARLVTWGRRVMVWCQPAALPALVVLFSHQSGDAPYSTGPRVLRVLPGNDALLGYDFALIAVGVVVTFAVVWSVLAAYLANRRALRLLCEQFGAVPPAGHGAPATCRDCGAPLPEGDDLLVRCVYCGAENVIGIDPRPAALRRRSEKVDLDAALRHRRRARLRLLVTVPVCVLLTVGMARELARAWSIPKPVLRVPGVGADLYCAFSSCGTITNHDLVSRTVVVRRGNESQRATVLPGGQVWWSCPVDGHLQVGAQQLDVRDLAHSSALSIDHDALGR